MAKSTVAELCIKPTNGSQMVSKSSNLAIFTLLLKTFDIVDPNNVLLGKIKTPTFTTNLVFSGVNGLWLVGQGAVYRVIMAEMEQKLLET